jgi:hypothetical protein
MEAVVKVCRRLQKGLHARLIRICLVTNLSKSAPGTKTRQALAGR